MTTTFINNMDILSLNHKHNPINKYEEQVNSIDYFSDCTSDATVTTPAVNKEEKKTTIQQEWSLDHQLCDHQNSIMQSYLEPRSIHSKSCINHIPSSPCSSSTVSSHRCFKFTGLKSKIRKVFRFSSSVKVQDQYHHKEKSFPPSNAPRSPSVDSVYHPVQRHYVSEKYDTQSKMTKIKSQFSRSSSACDISFSEYHHKISPPPPLPPKSILKKNPHFSTRPKSAIEISQQQQRTPQQRHSILFLLNRRSHKAVITSGVRFNKLVSVHETWSKQDYDRGSDPDAVCTRLTSGLAQHIKQELNYYKLHEMTVHDSSRINTHFFL